MTPLVIILMGSPSDRPHAEKIQAALDSLGVESVLRIGSAHKVPGHVLDLLGEYEGLDRPRVYVTIAGRSNALSGLVDAQVTAPVIACPPPSDSFGGADVFSSLRMPGGVAPAVVLDPANAALLAAKILAVGDPTLAARIRDFQAANQARLLQADAELRAPQP